MNTPNHNTTPDTPTLAGHWWPRLIDHINTWWMDRRPTGPALRQALRIPPKPATAAILAAAAVTLGVAGLLLWWLITGIIHLIVGIATGIRNTTAGTTATSGHHLAAWSLTRTITQPVRTYLDQHATGLPVTGHALWLAWLGTTLGLFILATAGSRGARIGWLISGVTTAGMVYTGTPTPGRALAAGLAVTVWAVLSVAAFNRLMPIEPVHLAIHLPRRPRPDTD